MEIARHWRLKDQRYGLKGDQCPHCDEKHFPPNNFCTDCGETNEKDINIPDSFKTTTSEYNGTFRIKYAEQEAKPYSQMMYPEIDIEERAETQIGESESPIELKMETVLIYQASEVSI